MISGSIFITILFYHSILYFIVSHIMVLFGSSKILEQTSLSTLIILYFTLELQLVFMLQKTIYTNILIAYYIIRTMLIERKLR